MRAPLVAIVAALVAGTAASAAVRTFQVAGFDRVRNTTPFDVRVHVGSGFAARAEGEQATLDRLDLGVRDGQLTIGTRPGSWWRGWTSHGRTVIDVALPRIRGAAVSGPGNMAVDQARVPDFVGAVSGPGTLSIGLLETRDATLAVSGPGDLKVAGRADIAAVSLSGPGNLRATTLAAREATVSLSGPGNVDLAVREAAVVNLSGPGNVRIAGHPRCTVRKSGPGAVTCG